MNVFVVDDWPETRERLIALLRAVGNVTVVGEAEFVRDAIKGVLALPVDVLLLDAELTDGTCLDVLRAVKPQRPDMHVIVLASCGFANSEYRQASLAAGADVFLNMTKERQRIPEILRGWLALPTAAVP